MFGYIQPNAQDLSKEEQQRYSACYCGLCRALTQRHGTVGSLTLTYDMTFAVLLLSSLYEPQEESGVRRCAAHPLKPRPYWQSSATVYAADMNIALAYHKLLDDWQDEGKRLSRAEANLLKKHYEKVAGAYPRQIAATEKSLADLSAIEKEANASPDDAARASGAMMAELFIMEEDRWSAQLRQLGDALGRFIYLLDAFEDAEKDAKRGEYNPLVALAAEPDFTERSRDILAMVIAPGADALERLPLVQDIELLRNIVYSGVWTGFESAARKRDKGEPQ